MADDNDAVRVTKNNLGTHINQFVHKEQAALKHLLMYEHAALGLRGGYQQHAQKVRGKSGPGCIGQCHYGTVYERFYLVALLRGDVDVLPALLELDSQPAEGLGDDSEVLVGDVLDGEAAPVDGRHADERADLDHVRQQAVPRSVQALHAVDAEQVGADPLDAGRHNPAFALPVYTRLSDAEENERIRLAKLAGMKVMELLENGLTKEIFPAVCYIIIFLLLDGPTIGIKAFGDDEQRIMDMFISSAEKIELEEQDKHMLSLILENYDDEIICDRIKALGVEVSENEEE